MRICVAGLRGLPGVIGGIETHCENLYPRLVKLDPNLDVIIITRKGYGVERTCTLSGLRIQPLWAPRAPRLETLVHTLLALIHAKFRLQADVLHLHGIGPGFFAPLSRVLGCVTIVTHHAPDFERPKWGLVSRTFLRMGEFLAAYCAHRVICVSNSVKLALTRRYPAAGDRAVAIRNGCSLATTGAQNFNADLAQFRLEPGAYILAVGRLEETKGFHELIEAFSRAERPNMQLVIVGSAFNDDLYSRRLLQCKSGRVRFLGFQSGDALRNLYQKAALLIHPSHMEGFGLVVAEALSVGIPVAASDIPAHREFELEEECYFRPGDIDAMVRIISESEYTRFYSKHANRHTWERCAEEHLQIIESLTNGADFT